MNQEFKQGTPEWLEYRKNKIGASDAPVIMGVSPWTSPYQLWTYKLGLDEPKMNEAMQRGLEMENQAREAFNEFIGVFTRPKVYLDIKYPWMMASLDGISEGGVTAVEIKCPGVVDHTIALTGMVPDKYFPQLQHQLYVTGLPSMWYFSYRPSSDNAAILVDRDNAYIEKMIEAEKEFYRCMTEFDPPPLSERDYQDLSNNEEWIDAVNQYNICILNRKDWEDKELYCRTRMISIANGKNAKGNHYKLTKFFRKGPVEYSRIPELEKVNLEEYRKPPVESFRITEI